MKKIFFTLFALFSLFSYPAICPSCEPKDSLDGNSLICKPYANSFPYEYRGFKFYEDKVSIEGIEGERYPGSQFLKVAEFWIVEMSMVKKFSANWCIEKADEDSQIVSKCLKRFILDRNTGNVIYRRTSESSIERDKYDPDPNEVDREYSCDVYKDFKAYDIAFNKLLTKEKQRMKKIEDDIEARLKKRKL